ncbi:MAG TPA: glycosyltransferase [Dongiaceae bacterium]|nr:glycosyltransferase [Dongiaceae bacterium]
MRVLSVSESYAPFYEFGGPPVKVEALATGLAQRGNSVTVLSADWGFEKRRESDDGARRSPFGWTRESNGVTSIYLPTWFHYRASSWNPAIGRYLRARLQQFDAVHIFGLYDLLGPAVAKACRKRGIPYVVEPIGMFVPIVRSLMLKRLYHSFFGNRMIAGASAVIATAEQEVEELAAGGVPREKIVLRRNGVIAPRNLPAAGTFRAQRGIPPDARVILFLGRLSEKKSPELLLEAFGKLPAALDGRPLRLVFAGPDESGMLQRLRATARVLGVEERVSFTGAIFGSEKWGAYRDADVFVLPSQNENFGNTAAEAAAVGIPVVLTENCGVAPLLDGTAGIVTRHETEAVAQAVERILRDGQLWARLSEGGRHAAGRLGWDAPVEATESLYRRLAGLTPLVGQSAGQE